MSGYNNDNNKTSGSNWIARAWGASTTQQFYNPPEPKSPTQYFAEKAQETNSSLKKALYGVASAGLGALEFFYNPIGTVIETGKTVKELATNSEARAKFIQSVKNDPFTQASLAAGLVIGAVAAKLPRVATVEKVAEYKLTRSVGNVEGKAVQVIQSEVKTPEKTVKSVAVVSKDPVKKFPVETKLVEEKTGSFTYKGSVYEKLFEVKAQKPEKALVAKKGGKTYYYEKGELKGTGLYVPREERFLLKKFEAGHGDDRVAIAIAEKPGSRTSIVEAKSGKITYSEWYGKDVWSGKDSYEIRMIIEKKNKLDNTFSASGGASDSGQAVAKASKNTSEASATSVPGNVSKAISDDVLKNVRTGWEKKSGTGTVKGGKGSGGQGSRPSPGSSSGAGAGTLLDDDPVVTDIVRPGGKIVFAPVKKSEGRITSGASGGAGASTGLPSGGLDSIVSDPTKPAGAGGKTGGGSSSSGSTGGRGGSGGQRPVSDPFEELVRPGSGTGSSGFVEPPWERLETIPRPTPRPADTSKARDSGNQGTGTGPSPVEPDIVKPTETTPDTTKPTETAPDTTDPGDRTTPEPVVPTIVVPDDTVPDVTKPTETTPDTTKPGETRPDIVIPTVTIPDTVVDVPDPVEEATTPPGTRGRGTDRGRQDDVTENAIRVITIRPNIFYRDQPYAPPPDIPVVQFPKTRKTVKSIGDIDRVLRSTFTVKKAFDVDFKIPDIDKIVKNILKV